MSNRDADAAIISIAQHARPKPIGQMDDSRAQLSTRSMLVVMKLASKRWSIRPIQISLPSCLVVVSVFADERIPLLRRFVQRIDGFNGTRRDAGSTVDALVGMNIKHLGRRVVGFFLPRMDAVHGTDIHTGCVLRADARFADDISQDSRPPGLMILHDARSLSTVPAFHGYNPTIR